VNDSNNTPLDKLLLRLDVDRDKAAEKYLRLRDELANFLRLKNCPYAEESADEALDRTAVKIEKGEDVQNIRAYAFRVAKFVLLEKLREPQFGEITEDEERTLKAKTYEIDERLECLEHCMKKELNETERALISKYYEGEGRSKTDIKKALTEKFGLSMTALKLRALRIRERLEKCINRCVEKGIQ